MVNELIIITISIDEVRVLWFNLPNFFVSLQQNLETTMKKTALLLMSIVLLTACQETLEDRCAREAKEFTEKNCPRAVDKEIILDSMTFEKSTHTISYLYTLNGTLDEPLRINSAQFREVLLIEVKNSTNLKLYKDAGYSFRYCYYSAKENGTKLFEATFRKSDYQ